MAATKAQTPPRILMFPWLDYYGHVIPYLELAKKLTTKGFHIYLCSTPATLGCIEKNLSNSSIELVPLLLEVSPELPAKSHTTNGLPPHLMVKLEEAFDNSADSFSAILDNLKPDLLVFDFLQPWARALAEARGIPPVIFITSGSVLTRFMFHYFKNLGLGLPFPFKNMSFRDYERCDTAKIEKGSAGFNRSYGIVLIKGFKEIQGSSIDKFSHRLRKRFVFVGPLVPEPTSGIDELLSWLETKEAGSTVLVSFGSDESFLSKEDMEGIAQGLLLSKVNFVWVVRFPEGSDFLEKKFPEGFLGERGKILEGWAQPPQTSWILGHASVGGFVSQCDWNSVMESMKFGVPIIAVPTHPDQTINARLVEELGVGEEVSRNMDGKLSARTLAAYINYFVLKVGGYNARYEAAQMKSLLEWRGESEIDKVAEDLMKIRRKRKN